MYVHIFSSLPTDEKNQVWIFHNAAVFSNILYKQNK